MSTRHPVNLRSGQWLPRVGLAIALAAAEIALSAVCGLSGLRLVAVALAALVFVAAYLVTPSPGKPAYDPAALRPLLVMRAASLLAAAATGGFSSPFLPMVAVPIAIAWAMQRPRLRDVVLGLATVALLLVLCVPVIPPPRFTAVELAVLAGSAIVLATWTIGHRVVQLLEVQRMQAACLARLREGALVDAASRRRGLESMTTKLAHELKNPLAAIKSLVQLERSQSKEERSARRLDVVLGEVERISAILREYLDLARPVEEARVAPVLLGELMSDVSTLVAGRAESAGVELTVGGTCGTLHADARLLKEAIVNVVCNAIEATPRGGSVAIAYQLCADGATIVIRDSGCGMTREAVTRVGTPFFTTREGCMGLGVVSAKTAIAQHRGTLEYHSTPGAGTIARIALPLDPRAQDRASA